MAPTDNPTEGLTLRELVLEVRTDVKELRADADRRLTVLEANGFRVQGAWTTISVGAAVLMGSAGLVLGVISAL